MTAITCDDEATVTTMTLEAHAAAINAEHQAAMGCLNHARRCGEHLIAAKAVVKAEFGHGQWLPWLAMNYPDISKRTAQLYMQLAKTWPKIDVEKRNAAALSSIRDAVRYLGETSRRPKIRHEPVAIEGVTTDENLIDAGVEQAAADKEIEAARLDQEADSYADRVKRLRADAERLRAEAGYFRMKAGHHVDDGGPFTEPPDDMAERKPHFHRIAPTEDVRFFLAHATMSESVRGEADLLLFRIPRLDRATFNHEYAILKATWREERNDADRREHARSR
jgi:hypothetical protein